MATTAVANKLPISFTYDNLVSQVELIRNQIVQYEKAIDDLCKDSSKLPTEVKTHSLVFIDCYGNQMINDEMDHQLMEKVVRKYKKQYIPKYLHEWVQIGIRHNGTDIPLSGIQLKKTVGDFHNRCPLVAYGLIAVWLIDDSNIGSRSLEIPVQLMDDAKMVEIKAERYSLTRTALQLKLCTMSQSGKPNEQDWNDGKPLRPDDTILSCHLYRKDLCLLAKLSGNIVKSQIEDQVLSFEDLLLL